MFDLRICNRTLSKECKFKVRYPNWSEVSGEAPHVNMIMLEDGCVLFDLNDIVYAINDYADGLKGNNYMHVRDIVTSYLGYGTVVVFRRGGIYANITACKSICNHWFSQTPYGEAPAYCRIAHASVLYALTHCTGVVFEGSDVEFSSRVMLDDLTQIVPSTLEVTKAGVFGVPIKPEVTEEDEEPQEQEQGTSEVSTEAEAEIPTKSADTVEFSPIAALTAMQELIRQLSNGKKIVITLGLE
jgi:hypothetical protein